MTGVGATGDVPAEAAADELHADRRRERALLWKGLAAAVVVVVVVVVRQLWLT